MSSRFYFDLTNGKSILRDEKGVWVSDLAEAIRNARVVIEEMRHSGELSEHEEGWVVVIKDAIGGPLMTLPVIQCAPVMKS